MDKQTIKERYLRLQVELGENARSLIVNGDASLVLLGIKEKTPCLNIDVSKNVLNWAFNKKLYTPEVDPNLTLLDGEFNRFSFDSNVVLQEADEFTGLIFFENIWSYSPSALLTQKRYLIKTSIRSDEEKELDLKEVKLLERLVHERKLTAVGMH